MKKQGIVLKLGQNKMIVLTDEGEFLERPLPHNPPPLGAKVELFTEKPDHVFSKLALVATLLIFVLSIGILRPILIPPAVAAVAFDLPIGIELGVDEKNKIVKVTAKDKRGEAVAADLELKGQDVYLAANQLIEAAFRLGELEQAPAEEAFFVTVMPLRGSGKMMLDTHLLNESMKAMLSKQAFDGYLILQNCNEDLRKPAAKLGLPVAKYLLWQRGLDTEDELISLEELKSLPLGSLVTEGEEMLEKRFPGMWHQLGHQNGMSGMGSHMGQQGSGMGSGNQGVSPGRTHHQQGKGMMR